MLSPDLVRKHSRFIINNTFPLEVTFFGNNSEEATVRCTVTETHVDYDEEGTRVYALNAKITVSEQDLIDAGYTVRNAKNQVSMLKHKVHYTIGGIPRTAVIEEHIPDNTFGVIPLRIAYYE